MNVNKAISHDSTPEYGYPLQVTVYKENSGGHKYKICNENVSYPRWTIYDHNDKYYIKTQVNYEIFIFHSLHKHEIFPEFSGPQDMRTIIMKIFERIFSETCQQIPEEQFLPHTTTEVDLMHKNGTSKPVEISNIRKPTISKFAQSSPPNTTAPSEVFSQIFRTPHSMQDHRELVKHYELVKANKLKELLGKDLEKKTSQ